MEGAVVLCYSPLAIYGGMPMKKLSIYLTLLLLAVCGVLGTTVHAADETGQIEITLVSAQELKDREKQAGMRFDIQNSEGDVVDSVTTDSEGTATSKQLPYGEYRILYPKANVISREVPCVVGGEFYRIKIDSSTVAAEIAVNMHYSYTYWYFVVRDDSGNDIKEPIFFDVYCSGTNTYLGTVRSEYFADVVDIQHGAIRAVGQSFLKLVQASELEGYEKVPAEYFGYDPGGGVYGTTLKITKIRNVKVTCVGPEGEPIPNVHLEIRDKSNSRFVTDDSGVATSCNLPEGTYTLDVLGGVGYTFDAEASFSVSNDAPYAEVKLVGRKIAESGKVVLEAKDADDHSKLLPDVEFDLYSKLGTFIATLTTDNNGYAEYDGLPAGEYYLQEKTPPFSCKTPDTCIEFSLTEHGQTVENVVYYKFLLGKIKIYLKDSGTRCRIGDPGFVLSIVNEESEEVCRLTSDGSGVLISDELFMGTYTILDVSLPEGYHRLYQSVVTVTLMDAETVEVDVWYRSDKPSLAVQYGGVEYNYSNDVAGTTFGVFDSEDTLVKTLVLTDSIYTTNVTLPPGDYRVELLKAARWDYIYEEYKSVTVTLTTSDELVEMERCTGYGRFIFTIRDRLGNLYNPKVDYDGTSYCSMLMWLEVSQGAYGAAGPYMNSSSPGLHEAGEYDIWLYEDDPYYPLPDWCTSYIPKRVHVVLEHGESKDIEFTLIGPEGSFTIRFLDKYSNNPIAGVPVKIYDEAKARCYFEFVTDSTGEIQQQLPVGRYKFKYEVPMDKFDETEYEVWGDVVVTQDGDTIDKTVYLSPKVNSAITITNVDDSAPKKPLEGMSYEYFFNDESKGTVTSDANGKIELAGVFPGEYKFVAEVHADFTPSEREFTITIDDYETAAAREVVWSKSPVEPPSIGEGKIKLSAMDLKTTNLLPGARFLVYAARTNVQLQSMLTGEDGTASSNPLAKGEYYLKEAATPEGYKPLDKVLPVEVIPDQVTEVVAVYKPPEELLEKGGLLRVIRAGKTRENRKPGVTIAVLTPETEEIVGQAVTDDEGVVTFEMAAGNYLVRELLNTSAFIYSERTYEVLIRNGQETELWILDEDDENESGDGDDPGGDDNNDSEEPPPDTPMESGLLRVTVNNEDGSGLSGAVLEVAGSKMAQQEIMTTNARGVAEIRLDAGEYKLKQLLAPSGYTVVTETLEFTIVGGDTVEYVLVNVKKSGGDNLEDPYGDGTLKINCVDAQTGEAVRGAVFGIYDSEDFLAEKISTGSSGVAETDLEPGNYRIKDFAVLDEYARSSELIRVKIVSDKTKTITVELSRARQKADVFTAAQQSEPIPPQSIITHYDTPDTTQGIKVNIPPTGEKLPLAQYVIAVLLVLAAARALVAAGRGL